MIFFKKKKKALYTLQFWWLHLDRKVARGSNTVFAMAERPLYFQLNKKKNSPKSVCRGERYKMISSALKN